MANVQSLTKIQAIRCPHCLDIIYSRAVHDYHFCSCGDDEGNPKGVSIDGGFDYLRYGWANDIDSTLIEAIELELPISKRELYDDWNYGRNVYGIIPDKDTTLLNWFWDKVEDNYTYEVFLSIYSDFKNRNQIVEQLYCQAVYE
jgi:hypothetical protein